MIYCWDFLIALDHTTRLAPKNPYNIMIGSFRAFKNK